jgi:acetyl-CoA synthetase
MDQTNLIPFWQPSEKELKESNIAYALHDLNLQSYDAFYHWSIQNREQFWDYTTQKLGIHFQIQKKYILSYTDIRNPHWFLGAELNIIESCFQASANTLAILGGNEQNQISKLTYGELQQKIGHIAASIQKAGFKKGDVLGIAIPMHAEAVAIYLSIIYAGCTVCAIAESFATDEIAARLRITQAKAVFTQDNFIRNNKKMELYNKVRLASDIPAIILSFTENQDEIKIRPQDCLFKNFLCSENLSQAVSCKPDDPMTILFSSGTTGDPKAIPWTHITPIKSASDAYYHHNLKPNDRFAWPTSLGWMMGPFIVFATLINKATLVLFEGSPSDKIFGEFIQNQKITHLGLVPSLVKQWRISNCLEGLDWSHITLFASTGECSNADDMAWLSKFAGIKPIIEYCGGTETGGGYITGTVVQPFIPGTFSTPALGIDFVLLDNHNKPSGHGEVALIPPSIGLSNTLLNRDHHEVYYQGMPMLEDKIILRRHGDEIEQLENGYYRALGRVDDTMNLGGIKVSSAEIERTLNTSELYLETAAIAVNPKDGGPSLLVIYYVANSQTPDNQDELKKAMQQSIREKLNPLFKIHDIVNISALPRTASNKVMRRVLRGHYES